MGLWGIPACICLGVNISPSTETLNFLSETKELISVTLLTEKFYLNAVKHQRLFSISKNTAAVDRLLLKFMVTWSLSRMHSSVVL